MLTEFRLGFLGGHGCLRQAPIHSLACRWIAASDHSRQSASGAVPANCDACILGLQFIPVKIRDLLRKDCLEDDASCQGLLEQGS